jgi:hypothetical protein
MPSQEWMTLGRAVSLPFFISVANISNCIVIAS